MSLEIYLIRHAETEVNAYHSDKIGGRSNWAELTPKGVEQAKALGEYFFEDGIIFDAFYSSPTVRTQQTARYCMEMMGYKFPKVVLEGALIESDQGDFEGKFRKSTYSRTDVAEGLAKDSWNYIPGDLIKGESQYQVAKRMVDFLKSLEQKHSNQKICVFSHGNAIKYTLTELFNLDKQNAYKISVDNTSLNIIKYDKGKPSLILKNWTPHFCFLKK